MDIIDQPRPATSGYLSVDEVVQKGYSFRLGEYFGRALDILKKQVGTFAIATLVMFAIQFVTGLLPYVGSLAGLFLSPAFYGSFILMAHRASIGEQIEVGELFAGFRGERYGRLLGTYLLSALIGLIFMLPVVFIVMAAGPSFGDLESMQGDPAALQEIIQNFWTYFENPGVLWWTLPVLLLVLLVYVGMSMAFSFVVLTECGPMDAIRSSFALVSSKWLWFFFYALVLGFCSVLGIVALCVGILFTYPIAMIGMFTAFDHIMKGQSSSQN